MATREEIVKFLRNSLTNIKEVIGKLDEIDKNLENISPNEASEEKELVNETKQLFDDLFDKSSKTKDKFHQKYKKILRDKNNKGKGKQVQGNSSTSENPIQSNNVNIEEGSLNIRDVLVDTDVRETAILNFDSELYITLDENESITEQLSNTIDINNEKKKESKGIRSNVNKDLNEESDAQPQNSGECTKSKEKTSIKKITILEQNKSKKAEVTKERDENERELDQGNTSAKDIDKDISELMRTKKSHEKEKLHQNDINSDVCNSKTSEYADKIIDTSQNNSDVPKINEKITDTIFESNLSDDVENVSRSINDKEVKAQEISETRSQSSDKDTERNNNLKGMLENYDNFIWFILVC